MGLTKYREGLAELRIFTSEECGEIVDIIEAFQKKALSERGRRFVFASDEIYIKAGRKIPSHECYDGFPQIENGVGMVSLLEYELNEYLKSSEGQKKLKKACRALKGRRRIITIAVGVCAYEHIKEMAERVSAACEALGGNINVNVIKIINNFFGENVTVSGLITGGDLIKQLRDRELGENLLITSNMLRNGERIFLDDVTVDELESELKIKVVPVADSGSDFAESIAGISD